MHPETRRESPGMHRADGPVEPAPGHRQRQQQDKAQHADRDIGPLDDIGPDRAEIADIDVGVLALATNPLKSKKNGDGQSATSVSFAGITIRPDDYLYVDEDGWLVAHERLHTGS